MQLQSLTLEIEVVIGGHSHINSSGWQTKGLDKNNEITKSAWESMLCDWERVIQCLENEIKRWIRTRSLFKEATSFYNVSNAQNKMRWFLKWNLLCVCVGDKGYNYN